MNNRQSGRRRGRNNNSNNNNRSQSGGRGGVAILEIGHMQRILVTELAEAAGFAVECRQDLGGRDRALLLTRA